MRTLPPEKTGPNIAASPPRSRTIKATEEDDEPDTTSIQDLRDSMLRIGYVAIDKMWTEIKGTKKYIVLEGNRRVAALKSLKRDYEAGPAPFHKAAKRADYERHKESFETLTVLEFKTEGLSSRRFKRPSA